MRRDSITGDSRTRHAEPGQTRASQRQPEREPNAVDHYSLALQIIQVFPIVTEPIVLVLPYTWIARTIAGFALIGATVLVIRAERHRHAKALGRQRLAEAVPTTDPTPAMQKYRPDEDFQPTETEPQDTEARPTSRESCTIEIVIVLWA